MANELPLTTSTSSLTRFLAHIQASGVPKKIDRPYLKSVGFKSGVDGYLIPIMKHIGFVSTQGVPENRWKSYRDKARAPKILAEGVLEGYSELFAVYPDAYRKDEEALRNWVRSQTEYDEIKVGHAVKTFQALAGLAKFDETLAEESESDRATRRLLCRLSTHPRRWLLPRGRPPRRVRPRPRSTSTSSCTCHHPRMQKPTTSSSPL